MRWMTMLNVLSIGNILDALVPITRFNRGEAGKIFDEVRETGCKVVVKNNVPACVMLTPEKYKEMVDMIEDQYLLALAEERLKNDTGATYTQKELMERDGVTYEDLEKIPMEYGVDFE
jgi:PHD/YefM family antitoxin component YafN of YafNO toxin-antitoxin module